MSAAITLTKILLNSSILYIFITRLAESYDEKPIQNKQKILKKEFKVQNKQ